MSDGGKGDSRRPMAISDQQYAQRWDLIFGKEADERACQGSDQENGVGLEGSTQHHGKGRDPATVSISNQGSNNV